MDRVERVFGHLKKENGTPAAGALSPVAGRSPISEDDVVVVQALRTPICKAKRGAFKDTPADDLLSAAFNGILNSTGIKPSDIQDICVGNVLEPGAGGLMARCAQFYSGIPETVPIHCVNRQCSSGLQAFMNIAGEIKAGAVDIGMAAGVESMSGRPMGSAVDSLNPRIFETPKAQDCLTPMGITSENVAERFGISREKQDKMAMESHEKAMQATEMGHFRNEIIPVTVVVKDQSGQEKTVIVSKDDGIRKGTTMQVLGKLKPAFKPEGSTTAGNSSQVSDGAAAVLVARRSAARRMGLPVLGVLRGFAVVGVPPDIMGIGPAVAIPEAVKKAGVALDDIDIFEINEAFASQATYCVEKLGIPMSKVNPKGGAIALGHPLGCTGARQIGTLLHEMKRRGKRGYGVVSMCIGTGMGAAAVFEYPGQ